MLGLVSNHSSTIRFVSKAKTRAHGNHASEIRAGIGSLFAKSNSIQTVTTPKETILHKKSEIKELLKEAIEHHRHCDVARTSVTERQRMALWHAWQVGIRLNSIKPLIPRGDWADWLDLNFCQPLKISVRTAQVYMKIDHDNAELRDDAKTQRAASTEPDFQLLRKLKLDTIRKYAYTIIPEKPYPYKGKDIRIGRLYSFGTVVNEYCRIRTRHVCGLNEVNFKNVRDQTDELYRFLRWIHGDSKENPWDSYAYPKWRINAMRKKDDQIVETAHQRFRELFPNGLDNSDRS